MSMTTMNISAVKSRLNSLVNDVYRQETRILVEKSGIPVAAIIPLPDLRRLLRLDERNREAREVVESMRAAFADVPDEEIERQTERIMNEIRAENRAARQRIAQTA
ncbi:MAG: type II toxin-antitoxin system Phd/YefM family antitoxin [Thermomicrobiales bacterium]